MISVGPSSFALLQRVTATLHDPRPAPIAAAGFGAVTPWPAAPAVHRVTTLADGGAGSLRAALGAVGPRVVVFEVAGRIALASPIEVRGQCVVLGHTAPGSGVVVTGARLSVIGSDVVLMGLTVWTGFDPTAGDPNHAARDAIQIGVHNGATVSRVVVQGCDFALGQDETVDVWNSAHDITLVDCAVYDPLWRAATHPDADPAGDRASQASYTMMIAEDARRVSILNCLITGGEHRHPQIKAHHGVAPQAIEVVGCEISGGNHAAQVGGQDAAKTATVAFVGNTFHASAGTAASTGDIKLLPHALVHAIGNVGSGRGPLLGRNGSSPVAVAPFASSVHPYRTAAEHVAHNTAHIGWRNPRGRGMRAPSARALAETRAGTIPTYKLPDPPADYAGAIPGPVTMGGLPDAQGIRLAWRTLGGVTTPRAYAAALVHHDEALIASRPAEIAVGAAQLTLISGFVLEANGQAPGGQVVKANDPGSEATWTWAGPTDAWDVFIDYFDENDGAGSMEVRVGATVWDRWTWDEATASPNANSATLRTRHVELGRLAAGDVVGLVAKPDRGERPRVARLRFQPSAEWLRKKARPELRAV